MADTRFAGTAECKLGGVGSLVGVALAAVILAGEVTPTIIVAAIAVLVFSLAMAGSYFLATVQVGQEDVTVRWAFRERRIALAEISGLSARPEGVMRVPTMVLHDGREVPVRALTSWPGAVEERLRMLQGALDASADAPGDVR